VTEVIDGYVTLFRGRADCYGSWDGGCVRDNLTRMVFHKHLTSGPHVGVYPSFNVEGVAHCAWGCTDIDYDGYDDALLLHDTLKQVGITTWLERTNKGWHVWAFATTLVPAEHMRNMFLAAHQVCELTPKEVNPKQTVLSQGQVGNYVRLPYPAALDMDAAQGARRIVDTSKGPDWYYHIKDFVKDAVATRLEPDHIAQIANYYEPPAEAHIDIMPELGDVTAAVSLLRPLGKIVYREGPREGRDRSSAITLLAHECYRSGLAAGDALKVLEAADWQWGKYLKRGLRGEAELVKLVQRAYGSLD
jgi:hypothetical protein